MHAHSYSACVCSVRATQVATLPLAMQVVSPTLAVQFRLVQQYRKLFNLRVQYAAAESEDDKSTYRDEIQHEERMTERLAKQAGCVGMVMGDAKWHQICTDYSRQKQVVLQRKIMTAAAELGSASVVAQRARAQGGRRAALAPRALVGRAISKVERSVQGLLDHASDIDTKACGYDTTALSTAVCEWLRAGANPELQPEWPWAAECGYAPAHEAAQRYYRCVEELSILLREANDMNSCFQSAIEAWHGSHRKLSDTVLQLQEQMAALSGEAAVKAHDALLVARGKVIHLEQRQLRLLDLAGGAASTIAAVQSRLDEVSTAASGPTQLTQVTGAAQAGEAQNTAGQAVTTSQNMPTAEGTPQSQSWQQRHTHVQADFGVAADSNDESISTELTSLQGGSSSSSGA
jgi:hypothetical protein